MTLRYQGDVQPVSVESIPKGNSDIDAAVTMERLDNALQRCNVKLETVQRWNDEN